jgi:hypothetical protein
LLYCRFDSGVDGGGIRRRVAFDTNSTKASRRDKGPA